MLPSSNQLQYRHWLTCLLSVALWCIQIADGNAQTLVTPLENYIYTAFPFLRTSPDAAINGMGETGTAVGNANNIFTNASANLFMPHATGGAIDFKRSGNKLLGLSAYTVKKEKNAFSGGLRYNSLGGTTTYTPTGSAIQTSSNYELALDANYCRKFSDHIGMGLTLKYIYSTIAKGAIINGVEMLPVSDMAGDISFFYHTTVTVSSKDAAYNFGINISNLGGKVQYGFPDYTLFTPANLSIGTSLETKVTDNSTFTVALDLNKLLVPTLSGSDVSALNGAIHSFNDAPGGAQEELHEITIGTGVAYNYDNRVFLRGGYYYEHPSKGGRTYYALGAGIGLHTAQLNVAYRFYNNTQAVVVDNVLNLSLSYFL